MGSKCLIYFLASGDNANVNKLALLLISGAIYHLAGHAARVPLLIRLIALIGHLNLQSAGLHLLAFVTFCTCCLILCYCFVFRKTCIYLGYFIDFLTSSDVAY